MCCRCVEQCYTAHNVGLGWHRCTQNFILSIALTLWCSDTLGLWKYLCCCCRALQKSCSVDQIGPTNHQRQGDLVENRDLNEVFEKCRTKERVRLFIIFFKANSVQTSSCSRAAPLFQTSATGRCIFSATSTFCEIWEVNKSSLSWRAVTWRI